MGCQQSVRPRPQDVGILSLSVYVPPLQVLQADLEAHDGVEGKYTDGYGQTAMSVCSPREDVISMALTAMADLMRQNDLLAADIGRVDVGTESDIDSAKSVKSTLMQLLDGGGDVEGGDHKGACYAGTAALLAEVDWVSGEGWDGRLAVVVTTDVAVYTEAAARATGGAGAVAMLVGADAPLPLQRSTVASHSQDVYDWFKPKGPIPQVNGKLSVSTYLSSLQHCHRRLQAKVAAAGGGNIAIDYGLLHHPYNKLVQKGADQLAKLLAIGVEAACVSGGEEANVSSSRGAQPPASKRQKSSFYNDKVAPSTRLSRECGNMYTASLYACLASLVAHCGSGLEGKTLLMYSFGSGAMSSMFLIKARATKAGRWSLGAMASQMGLEEKLRSRAVIMPHELEDAIARQVAAHSDPHTLGSAVPADVARLPPSTYYLQSVGAGYERRYVCHQSQAPPPQSPCTPAGR